MADWVELRVHGVSGTPPESMLGSAHVLQVAGDDRTRVFRPTDAQLNEVRPADGHLLEAFHWGRWTSGSWTQALWLLLIPFGMANAAQFMLPGPPGGGSRLLHTLCSAVLRLLALVLTGLITVAAAVAVLDLLTWQWLARRDIPIADSWLLVGALLVTSLLVLAVSVLGQTYRGARFRFAASSVRPEGKGLPGLGSARFFDGDPDNPTLRALHRAAGLLLLGALGLSVGGAADVAWADTARGWAILAVVVTILVVVFLGDPEETIAQFTVKFWHGWGKPDEQRPESWAGRLGYNVRRLGASWVVSWLLLGVAVFFLGLAVACIFQAHPQPGHRLFGLATVAPHFPAIDDAAAAIGVAGTLVVGAQFVVVAVLALVTKGANTPRLDELPLAPFRRFAGGMTSALASAVGFFLGIGLTAGSSLTVQGALNRLPKKGAPIEAPPVLQRVSYAWGLTAGLIVLLVVVVVAWKIARGPTFRRRSRAMMTFGADPEPRLPDRWLRTVAGAMELARLKKRSWLVSVFWLFSAAGVLFSFAATSGYAAQSHWRGPGRWLAELGSLPEWSWLSGVSSRPGSPVTAGDIVIGIGQLTLLGLATGAVLIARGAIRAEGSRRALNVVWDVIAFWPRVAHPFVPPPYAQSVVPALVRRICWHLGVADPLRDVRDERAPDGRRPAPPPLNPAPVDTVVLAAHSQGSLISLAALLWLPLHARGRVRWLTFGSQLRQQFPRAFPHYVTVSMLRDAQLTHRWLNLYRDTDHIAGPVTSWGHTWEDPLTSFRLEAPAASQRDVVRDRTGRRECGREWRLLDPVPEDRALQLRPAAQLQRHSNYWLDPDWDDALDDVRSGSAGVTGEPASGRAAQTVST